MNQFSFCRLKYLIPLLVGFCSHLCFSVSKFDGTFDRILFSNDTNARNIALDTLQQAIPDIIGHLFLDNDDLLGTETGADQPLTDLLPPLWLDALELTANNFDIDDSGHLIVDV